MRKHSNSLFALDATLNIWDGSSTENCMGPYMNNLLDYLCLLLQEFWIVAETN